MSARRLPAGERREQIISCSIDALARSNYQKMRVADVAELVGVSEAAIYKYFPTKKRLFLAVLRYLSDGLINNLSLAIQGETDTIEAIRKAATAFTNADVNPPKHVRIRSKAIAEVDDSEISAELQRDHLAFVLLLRGIVENGVRQGAFRSDLNVDTIVLLLDATGMFVETLKLLSLEGNTAGDAGLGLINRVIDLMRA